MQQNVTSARREEDAKRQARCSPIFWKPSEFDILQRFEFEPRHDSWKQKALDWLKKILTSSIVTSFKVAGRLISHSRCRPFGYSSNPGLSQWTTTILILSYCSCSSQLASIDCQPIVWAIIIEIYSLLGKTLVHNFFSLLRSCFLPLLPSSLQTFTQQQQQQQQQPQSRISSTLINKINQHLLITLLWINPDIFGLNIQDHCA